MIEQRLLALKQIAESPATAFTHWIKSFTFVGFDPKNEEERIDLLGYPKVWLSTFGSFKVPRGKALIITKTSHDLFTTNSNVSRLINMDLRFFFANQKRKTSARNLQEILNGDLFLIFNANEEVKLQTILINENSFETFSEGNFSLTTRLDGFICERNLMERLISHETIFV
jgi:hypothetical protein